MGHQVLVLINVLLANFLTPLLIWFQCKPEYKVPGLYVIDSIVRQSRHQFGPEKDVFAPRFAKNMQTTFINLFRCPPEDKVSYISNVFVLLHFLLFGFSNCSFFPLIICWWSSYLMSLLYMHNTCPYCSIHDLSDFEWFVAWSVLQGASQLLQLSRQISPLLLHMKLIILVI
jgi:hypothetical protein